MTRARRLTLAASALLLAACQDEAPPAPAGITAVGETALSGTVAELVGTPLVVRVTNTAGAPAGGVPVAFTVSAGGGSVTKATDTTNASGQATTTWRLGEKTGQQRVTATAAGVAASVEFIATARAGAPASIAISTGDGQSAVAGATVTTNPAVLVKDRFQNPVPGVSVLYSAATGGGSVTNAGSTTNNEGIATVGSWRLGPAVGANTLTALALASGVTGNPVTFNATGTAGTAATLTARTATTLTGTVGTLVTPVPSVRVTDANGNAVQGAAVTFTASTGSSVINGTKTTDAQGVAAPDGWQLGSTAQSYTLTASSPGVTSVVFTAAARAGAAGKVIVAAGDNQVVVAGRPVPVDPAVKVTDALDNPVAGVEVTFTVLSGGGTATGRNVVTNSQGVATVGGWTLGDAVGTNTLRATVAGDNISGNPITFTALGTAGTAATMAVSAGQAQSAVVGTTVSTPPAVVVRDARGNGVAGVAVTFSIGAGGGTLTGATASTNANGVATVGSWTLGSSAGTQALVARANGLPDVTFTATATSAGASRMTAVSSINLGSITVANQQAAPQLPTVRVTDSFGNPVAGVAITFAVGNATSGTITGASQVTSATGEATLGGWTLPTTAGIASVVASAQGLTGVTFVATMTPGAPTAVAAVSATSLGEIPATAGGAATAAQMPSVRVTDTFGNPVAGTAVTFATGSSNPGTITGATATTGLNGIATLGSWTFPTRAGATSVTASVTGLTPVTFTATMVQGAPSVVQALSSTSLGTVTIEAGAAASPRPSVRVLDEYGNAIAGVTVTFAPGTTNPGTVTGGTQVTAANGVATVGNWVYPTTSGSTTLTATVAGLTPVTFTATMASAGAGRLTLESATSAVTAGNTLVVTVTARDAFGNVSAGYTGTKSLTFSGASAAPGGQAATANGVAFGTATSVIFTSGVGTVSLVIPRSGTSVVTATDGTISADGTNALTVSVASAATTRLSVTGTGSQAAGAAQTITVTARDAYGNTATGYTGFKSLTFSGANIPTSGVAPTVAGTAFGIATGVTFDAGVATATMILRRVETAIVAVSDGTIESTGADRLTVVVSAAAASRFVITGLLSTQTAGTSQTITISTRDAFGNLASSYAGEKSLVFTGATSSPNGSVPTVESVTFGLNTPITFAGGIATATLVLRRAETAVVAATEGTVTTTGTDQLTVVVSPNTAASLLMTGSSTQVAGAAQTITITARDIFGNAATGYVGSKSLTFTGAGTATAGASPNPTVAGTNGVIPFTGTTSLTFSSGVATASMELKLAETALVAVTDGVISGTLSVVVSAGAAAATTSSLGASTLTPAQSSTNTTITVLVRDALGNAVLTATSASFVASVAAGSAAAGLLGVFTCVSGTCTASYTAPAAAGTNTVTATIGGVPIVDSPRTLTMP